MSSGRPNPFTRPKIAGMTINVSSVEEIMPPIIGTAMRCMISDRSLAACRGVHLSDPCALAAGSGCRTIAHRVAGCHGRQRVSSFAGISPGRRIFTAVPSLRANIRCNHLCDGASCGADGGCQSNDDECLHGKSPGCELALRLPCEARLVPAGVTLKALKLN